MNLSKLADSNGNVSVDMEVFRLLLHGHRKEVKALTCSLSEAMLIMGEKDTDGFYRLFKDEKCKIMKRGQGKYDIESLHQEHKRLLDKWN